MLRARRRRQASDPKSPENPESPENLESKGTRQVTRQVVLSFDDRYRRRHKLTTEDGFSFLLDLETPTVLQDGDHLLLDNGEAIAVVAAPEALMEAVPHSGLSMARMAWHIGNRHLEAEIYEHAIRLRQDHVIQAMLEQLGATVTLIEAPFSPEGGAYGHGRTHSHDHAHDHAHPHSHDHAHGHAHGHDHEHPHGHHHDHADDHQDSPGHLHHPHTHHPHTHDPHTHDHS